MARTDDLAIWYMDLAEDEVYHLHLEGWWILTSKASFSPCIMSVQCTGGCSVHRGNIMSSVGVSSTPDDTMINERKVIEKTIEFVWKPQCAEHLPVNPWYFLVYWAAPPPSVLIDTPWCTKHPPLYCITPGVLHRHCRMIVDNSTGFQKPVFGK